MQLTVAEQEQIRKLSGHEKKKGTDVIKLLNKNRKARRQSFVEKSTVYRFIRGETHVRGVPETRGRHKVLSRSDIRKLQQARRRLLREADSEEQDSGAH